MERVAGTLLALGLAWLLGYFLVAVFWRDRPCDPAGRLLCLAAAFGLGVGATASLDFLWLVIFGKAWRGTTVLLDLAVLLLLLFADRRLPRPSFRLARPLRPQEWYLGAIFLFFSAVALGTVGTLLLRGPDGAWDAIAIWNARAKFLNAPSLDGWKALFDPIMEITHPDYPPLLPASVARGWQYAGHSIPLVPMLLALSFTFALLSLITAAVGVVQGPLLGGAGCAVLASSPIFLGTAMLQYADLPLAYYFLLAVALLHRADQEERPGPGLHVLAGLAAGMAALTKNEGCLFVVALGAGRILRVLLLSRAAYRREKRGETPGLSRRCARRELGKLAWWLAGMAPALGLLLLYKSFAPANYLVSAQGSDWAGRLLSRPRASLIMNYVLDELARPRSDAVLYVQRAPTWHWHLLASTALLLLLGIDRRRLAQTVSRAVLVLAGLGLLAAILQMHRPGGSMGWHWLAVFVALSSIVGFGFGSHRLRPPSFLAAACTFVLVNLGYLAAFLLTPLDLRWQLLTAAGRLIFHTLPLAVFIAFLALVPFRRDHAG